MGVDVGSGVRVGVGSKVGVDVGSGVRVGVGSKVEVAVGVGGCVAVTVGVGVGSSTMITLPIKRSSGICNGGNLRHAADLRCSDDLGLAIDQHGVPADHQRAPTNRAYYTLKLNLGQANHSNA